MSNYYYVVAALPLLYFDKEAPVSLEYFLDFCCGQLKPDDYKLVIGADFQNFNGSFPQARVYGQYRAWEIALRNELVRLRAFKKEQDAAPYLRQGSEIIGLKLLVRKAFEDSSPLLAEAILNKARWDYLEELEVGHFFDVQKIVIYYLKLQLLNRKAYFQDELGKDNYTALLRHIFEELKTGVEVYEK
ncbi:MAG: DUF2764 family protein [Spirochaetales bacterium]|nr:DUF2764 family protein [Spirochaetales bacterium]